MSRSNQPDRAHMRASSQTDTAYILKHINTGYTREIQKAHKHRRNRVPISRRMVARAPCTTHDQTRDKREREREREREQETSVGRGQGWWERG